MLSYLVFLFYAIILLTNGWLNWSWKGSVLCQLPFSNTNASGIKVESSKQTEFVGQRSAVDYGKVYSKLCIYLTHSELNVLDVLWCSDMEVLI